MYEELKIALRNNADHYMTVEGAAGLVHLLTDAAAAIEELTQAKEELAEQVAYWQAQLTQAMCGETLADLEKSRWISVTERLPEKDDELDAMCWISDGPGTEGYCITAFYNRDTQKWISDVDWVEPWKITHWMPLPEPPKEEEKQ